MKLLLLMLMVSAGLITVSARADVGKMSKEELSSAGVICLEKSVKKGDDLKKSDRERSPAATESQSAE